MEQKERVFARLQELNIPYEVLEHAAVFTIADMEAQGILSKGEVCKNLFVRDSKGRQHFLIVAPEDRAIDLKRLAERLDSTKLSFASPERMEKYLGVAQGAVSPFGILNDAEHVVTVVLDASLRGRTRLGVHPNDNTATVWIGFSGIQAFVEAQGNPFKTITL